MIQSKFLKKALICTLLVTLLVTPMTVGASNPGSAPGPVTGGGNTGYVGGSTPTAVASNSVVQLADGKVLTSTVPGQYYAKNVAGVAVTTPLANVNAALAVGEGEKAQVRVFKSTCGELAQASVNSAAAALGVPVGPMLDIFAGKVVYGEFKNVEKTAAPITFSIGIPGEFKQAGMDYAVIRVQVGGAVTVLPDVDTDPNTVTFNTDGFGVFTIVKAPAGSFDAFK